MKSKELDQYYTNPIIAEYYYDIFKKYLNGNEILIEPSAGSGSFSKLLPDNAIKLDIDPKSADIQKMDYFEFKPDDKDYGVIGNPPFGKNASLAIKFFNHSKYANIIGFILPRSFRKPSVFNRLDKNFRLVFEEILPENSFIFNNKKYDVPCVFQIWRKSDKPRKIIDTKITFDGLEFTDFDNCDYQIRRVGWLAGKVLEKDKKYSKNSNYFIKSSDEIKDVICKNYEVLSEMAKDVSGNPSLSKYDLVKFLTEI